MSYGAVIILNIILKLVSKLYKVDLNEITLLTHKWNTDYKLINIVSEHLSVKNRSVLFIKITQGLPTDKLKLNY